MCRSWELGEGAPTNSAPRTLLNSPTHSGRSFTGPTTVRRQSLEYTPIPADPPSRCADRRRAWAKIRDIAGKKGVSVQNETRNVGNMFDGVLRYVQDREFGQTADFIGHLTQVVAAEVQQLNRRELEYGLRKVQLLLCPPS